MIDGIILLKAKADEAASIWGQIDVLVYNAGEISKIASFFFIISHAICQALGFRVS